MNRLINTKLFRLLEKLDGNSKADESDIKPAYEDFLNTIVSLCTSEDENTPAFFTLHYTRLRLEGFHILLSGQNAKKICLY